MKTTKAKDHHHMEDKPTTLTNPDHPTAIADAKANHTPSLANSTNSTSANSNSKPKSSLPKPTWQHLWLVTLAVLILLLAAGLITNGRKATAPAVISTAQVSINAKGFYPKLIQVKPNQAVSWTNYDTKPHWIASDPYPSSSKLPSLSSDALARGETYSYSFAQPGTYTYHDQLHPYKLQGTVVVK